MLRTGLVVTLILGSSCPLTATALAEPRQEPVRVGQIFVIGNTLTRQSTILRQVPLYPGAVLSYPDLKKAERNLARLNLFQGQPTVKVVDPEGDEPYKDILVTVEEARISDPYSLSFQCVSALEDVLESCGVAVEERRGTDPAVGFTLLTLEGALNRLEKALGIIEWCADLCLEAPARVYSH